MILAPILRVLFPWSMDRISSPIYTMWLVYGVALAHVYYEFRVARSARSESKVAYEGLVTAAVIYVLFAIFFCIPFDVSVLLVEVSGVLVYAILPQLVSWGGGEVSRVGVGIGWFVHVGWDLLVHGYGPYAHAAPVWYGIACLSFDCYLAGRLIFFSDGDRQHRKRE